MASRKREQDFFPLPEKMPCRPRQITVSPYTLSVVFDGHLEAEEAAARIIWFSQQEKRWVGVSWPRLLAIMKADRALNDRRFEQMKEEKQQRERAEHQRRWYHALAAPFQWLVLLMSTQKKEIIVPVSGVYAYGLPFVRHGLRFLVSGQWLRREIHHGSTVYYPTPKLIKRIMRKQGISAPGKQ